jgi:hypothetical protein
MKTRLVVPFIGCLFLLILVSLPGVEAARKLLSVPLAWKPTNSLAQLGTVDLTGIGTVGILVKPLADNREKPQLIGENREEEDEGKVFPVTTTSNVAEFCTERVGQLLKDFGLNSTKESGDRHITGEVIQFFVVERNTYVGDVRLKINVAGPDGVIRWTGIAAGSEKRFGRSYKADNYHEVLSDSLQTAVFNLIKDEGFRAALR